MEGIYFSEMSVDFHQIIQCYIPENRTLKFCSVLGFSYSKCVETERKRENKKLLETAWTAGETNLLRIVGISTHTEIFNHLKHLKVKLKLSLCLIKQHAVKVYWGSKCIPPLFSISTLDEGEWSVLRSWHFTRGERGFYAHWIGPRAGVKMCRIYFFLY
jgi:hypothetical protein